MADPRIVQAELKGVPHAAAIPGKANLEIASYLEPARLLPRVQNLLQHCLDHDGFMPIGEHIYLKLKAENSGTFPDKIKLGVEAAGALLGFLEVETENREIYPENPEPGEKHLVAYAQLLAQPGNRPSRLLGEMVVHPHLRGSGMGKQMLAKMVEIGKEAAVARLDLWAYHGHPHARSFASRAGLSPTRTLHHLRMAGVTKLPPFDLPPGFRIRAFQPGLDDSEWLALNRLVFAGHPENGNWTRADLELRFGQSWFDPADFLVLEDQAGKMVGFNWTKKVPARLSDLYLSPVYPEIKPRPAMAHSMSEGGSLGEIYIVGLHPDTRGLGLGRGLTILGLQHLRARGAHTYVLYVDSDNTPAVTLYYNLGFHLHHDDIAYSIDL